MAPRRCNRCITSRAGDPNVVSVAFIGDTPPRYESEIFDGLATIIERILNLVCHKMRHLAVDMPGEFDEAGLDTGVAGLPGKGKSR